MAYLLNGINISTYGIVAGHSGNSNIALSGCFDLPSRSGKCFHSWGDIDSVEPYVDLGNMIFNGRDLLFNGSIFGTNSVINDYLKSLYDAIGAFTDTVTLVTSYGSFSVYIKSVTPIMFHGGAKIIIVFREPVVTLTGILPAVGASGYTIDSIPFLSFGLYLSKAEALHDLPELKEQQFTIYGSEGYQITKRQNKTLDFNGFIIGTSLADFQSKVSALYKLFSSTGTRNIKINDEINVDCFAIEGFKIENVHFFGQVIANFKASLMIVNVNYVNELANEVSVLITNEAGVQILI